MVQTCVVGGCAEKRGDESSLDDRCFLRFHSKPTDPVLCKQWYRRINRAEGCVKQYSNFYVCSELPGFLNDAVL